VADWNWARHDLGPTISAQLTDENGVPYNLTGFTVTFIATIGNTGTPTIDATATIVDAANAVVSYTPIAADTALAGDFNVQFQINKSGSPNQKVSFPNNAPYPVLHIDADLDNA
jgi:hypothetical protein